MLDEWAKSRMKTIDHDCVDDIERWHKAADKFLAACLIGANMISEEVRIEVADWHNNHVKWYA